MKTATALLVAGSIFAAATPAMAQDADSSFTGFRVEAVGGYDSVKAGSSVDDDTNEDNNELVDGFAYGIAAGYDYDLGGVVLGAEAEFANSTADIETADGFGFAKASAGRDLYLGARIGAKVAPDVLLYAKGGYTNARLKLEETSGTTTYEENVDLDGWRIGAGAEYAMNDKMFLKLEYRYSNYSEGEVDFEDGVDSDRFDVDLDRHQVMAGVGVRF